MSFGAELSFVYSVNAHTDISVVMGLAEPTGIDSPFDGFSERKSGPSDGDNAGDALVQVGQARLIHLPPPTSFSRA